MKTQFDKIYVITLITNKKRQDFITYQFNQLGLDFEFIYGIDYYNFQNITWHNVYGDLKVPGEISRNFGCAIGHYQAVMQAYYLGYNNVLIFEDDVCLNRDKSLWENMLNNIPDDVDFITWDLRFKSDKMYKEVIDNINLSSNNYFKINNSSILLGAAMFAITNRNTMKLYLDNQHNYLKMSDCVKDFFEETNIKRYASKECLYIDQFTYTTLLEHNNELLQLNTTDNNLSFIGDMCNINAYFRNKENKYKLTDFYWCGDNNKHLLSRY